MRKLIKVLGMFFCFCFIIFTSSILALAIDNNTVKCEKNLEMYQFKFSDIEYYDGMFIAVGSDGMLKTSVDGHKWDLINVPTTKTLGKVLKNGTGYKLIGGNSIFSSKDGLTWNISDLKYLAGSLKDIEWNGEKYIAVGDSGSIYSSTDCLDWRKETSNVQDTISSIVWNGKKFVAVGGNRKSNGFIITSDDGVKWTKSSYASANALNNVIWTGEYFVVVGYGGEIVESSDGESWSEVDSGTKDDLYDVEFNGNIYIAVGSNANIIKSQDGMQWLRVNEPSNNINLIGVTWGNGKFIAVDSNITMESTVGIKWTKSETDYDKYFNKIAYNWERFVVVGGSYASGGIIYTSDDGEKWNEGRKGLPYLLRDVIWSDNKFVTVGEYGAILTSKDGLTWTKSSSATQKQLHSVLWDGKNYFAVGDGGVLITSSDGITWQPIDIPASSNFNDIIFNGSQYLIIGDEGIIFSSNNGMDWNIQNSGCNSRLIRAVWNGDKYVVLAGLGTIESNDGVTWNKTSVYWLVSMSDIACTGDLLIAVGWGIDGTSSVKISENGSKWYSVPNATSSLMDGITVYGNKFIAVGWDGAIVNGIITSSSVPKILVNGKLVKFDVPPENIDDRLFVPVRAIFEAIGAFIEWDDSTKTIIAIKGISVIELQINNKSAKVNDKEVLLDVPAQLKNDRVLVPVRFISESLGANVEWDSKNNTVQIIIENSLEQKADEIVRTDAKSISPKIKSISAGAMHSVALFEDGTVWAWGNNKYGQLGNGSNVDSNIPVKLENLNNIIAVACGDNFSLALKEDGTVLGWGLGAFHPSGYDINTPVQIEGLNGVVDISAASRYSFAVMQDGTVWTWGVMTGLQAKDSGMTKKPVRVLGLDNIISVSTFSEYGLALKNDGTVWTWGNYVGENGFAAYQVDGLSDVKAIAAGGVYNLALKADGTVWRVNHAGKGNIYKIEGVPNIVSISAGQYHYTGLDSNGKVWIWGNYYNVKDYWNYGTDFLLYSPVQVMGMVNITNIYSGYNHTFAVGSDDAIFSWGNNIYGQLGDGSNDSKNVPINVDILSDKADNQNVLIDGEACFWVWMQGIDGKVSEDENTVRGAPVKCIFN